MRRRVVSATILALLVAIAVEGVAAGSLWILARTRGLELETVPVADLLPKHREEIERLIAGEQATLVHDAELGWTLAPGAVTMHFRIDGHGVRVDESFASPVPPGVLRIAACGDSFTFGADIVTPYTFQEIMMRREPGLEVLNLAVPAYGPGQAWLRCRRLMRQWQPQIVLIGFIADDAGRAVNTFRPFFYFKSGLALGKPRFELDGDSLRLIPNPLPSLDSYRRLLQEPRAELPRIGAHDFHYATKARPSPWDRLAIGRLVRLAAMRIFPADPMWEGEVLNPSAEPFRTSEAVLAAFAKEVQQSGATAFVLLLPSRADLEADRRGDPVAYVHLRPALEARGVPVIDLLDGFRQRAREVPVRRLARVHYTRRGNAVVAASVLERLRTEGLLPRRSTEERHRYASRVVERQMRLPSVAALSPAERQALVLEIPGAASAAGEAPVEVELGGDSLHGSEDPADVFPELE